MTFLDQLKQFIASGGPTVDSSAIMDQLPRGSTIGYSDKQVDQTPYGDMIWYAMHGVGRTCRILYMRDATDGFAIPGPLLIAEIYLKTFALPGDLNRNAPEYVVVYRPTSLSEKNEDLHELCKIFLLAKPEFLDMIVLSSVHGQPMPDVLNSLQKEPLVVPLPSLLNMLQLGPPVDSPGLSSPFVRPKNGEA